MAVVVSQIVSKRRICCGAGNSLEFTGMIFLLIISTYFQRDFSHFPTPCGNSSVLMNKVERSILFPFRKLSIDCNIFHDNNRSDLEIMFRRE